MIKITGFGGNLGKILCKITESDCDATDLAKGLAPKGMVLGVYLVPFCGKTMVEGGRDAYHEGNIKLLIAG